MGHGQEKTKLPVVPWVSLVFVVFKSNFSLHYIWIPSFTALETPQNQLNERSEFFWIQSCLIICKHKEEIFHSGFIIRYCTLYLLPLLLDFIYSFEVLKLNLRFLSDLIRSGLSDQTPHHLFDFDKSSREFPQNIHVILGCVVCNTQHFSSCGPSPTIFASNPVCLSFRHTKITLWPT